MSLTSIDTLIDYVVRNNIPAKDIHKIGKAKLKKIRLTEYVDHATEAKLRKAAEGAVGQKAAAVGTDPVDETPEGAVETPEGVVETPEDIPEHYIPPPDYVRRVYPENSMMGIYEKHYKDTEKHLDDIKEVSNKLPPGTNPAMTKQIFDTFFYNYDNNKQFVGSSLKGLLAYCCKIHGVEGLGAKNMRKAYFVTNAQVVIKGQNAKKSSYPTLGSEDFLFVPAGTHDGVDVFFVTNKEYKLKKFLKSLSSPEYTDVIVTPQLWAPRALKNFARDELNDVEWKIWKDSGLSEFFKDTKPKEPVPVPYFGDAGYIDTVEDEVVNNMDNELEVPEEEVKGGWIWMFM